MFSHVFGVRTALLAGALALACPVWAEPAGLSFGAKFSYDRSEGNYGTNFRSSDITTSVSVSADLENYAFDLVLPYVAQTGPGRRIALAGRRAIVIIDRNVTSQGMGDITLGATRYLLNEESHGIDLDLGASYKIATASTSKGLGSGKDDLAVQFTLGRSVGNANFSFTGGYTLVGKPEGQDYRNSAFGSLDASYRIARPFTVGVTLGYGGATVSGVPASRDVTVYLTHKLSKSSKVELYVLEGRSTQSPDRGAGITISADF